MAFHQPTRHTLQRHSRLVSEDRDATVAQPPARQHGDRLQLDQSQTSWVLFAPVSEEATNSEFSEAENSIKTPGRSQLSDLGSLNSVARSDHHVDPSHSAVDDEYGDDDGELDSLDSHLPSFRSLPGRHSHAPQNSQHAAPVLPGHDGLGSFHLDHPVSGPDAQEQIYQFERFNPRRVRRRRESLDRPQIALDDEQAKEAEKRQRIEDWRLEHSRVLLNEIHRETRRRRCSQVSLKHVQAMQPPAVAGQKDGDGASDNLTWHDEDADVPVDEPESLLSRFTQTIIKDILGIDDRLLSILLGEVIPEEEDLSSTPRASRIGTQTEATQASSSWSDQIVERVSKELGFLVNQLSQHPGAFSTYSQVQSMHLPYAGLPMIPESASAPELEQADTSQPPEQSNAVQFRPTMAQNTQAIDIPGRYQDVAAGDVSMNDSFTKEEWETDLDIKLVFKYIRSRFTSRPSSSAGPAPFSTTSTQDAAAKAARVRQHHPLISRSRTTERRAFKATTPGSPVAIRHHSSCASQSTRRSARSRSSSRHYWDIGGSLGTGSVIASNGPMGSWGEV